MVCDTEAGVFAACSAGQNKSGQQTGALLPKHELGSSRAWVRSLERDGGKPLFAQNCEVSCTIDAASAPSA